MSRIHDLHSLQLEKERLKAECRMKEMQVQHRLNGLGDALPELLWLLIPGKGRSVLQVVRQLVQAFAGGNADASMFNTAFRLFRKIFSRKDTTGETQ